MPSPSPKRPSTGQPLANARHERFAQLVAQDVTYGPAYTQSGYKAEAHAAESAGSRLARNVEVARRIVELRSAALVKVQAAKQREVEVIDQQAEDAVASAAWIIQKSVEVAHYGMERVPVRDMFGKPLLEADGSPVMRMRDWKAADASMNRLAKMHPEFSEKHEVTGDVRLRVEALAAVASMTPEQLRTLAEQARTEG